MAVDAYPILNLPTGELVELAKRTMDEIKEKYSVMHVILTELNERSIKGINPLDPKHYDQDQVYPQNSIKD